MSYDKMSRMQTRCEHVDFDWQGTNASALEKDIGPEQFPINEHYFGLVNEMQHTHLLTPDRELTTDQTTDTITVQFGEPVSFIGVTDRTVGRNPQYLTLLMLYFLGKVFGNTCYCNSVLQALYFCRPFRENVLAYKAQQKKKENLLTCLADLFHSIATQKKKVGVIPPKKFISRLRKENDLFDNYMQQDAHEFLNYLLNTIADILQEEKKQEKQNGKLKNGNMNEPAESNKPGLTWVHEIFQGTLTNETRCLNCETCACLFWESTSLAKSLFYGRVCIHSEDSVLCVSARVSLSTLQIPGSVWRVAAVYMNSHVAFCVLAPLGRIPGEIHCVTVWYFCVLAPLGRIPGEIHCVTVWYFCVLAPLGRIPGEIHCVTVWYFCVLAPLGRIPGEIHCVTVWYFCVLAPLGRIPGEIHCVTVWYFCVLAPLGRIPGEIHCITVWYFIPHHRRVVVQCRNVIIY
ncbi:hypothetical protein STEG23_017822 [Scotinomys teguina]